jgi:ATP-dependent Lhr-like helicase
MLEAAAEGRDALLLAPTGGGKTLGGFLPSLVELASTAPSPAARAGCTRSTSRR